MEKQKITIKDIAEKAGVSKTTISRFLNNKCEYMSEETCKRISHIIDELNYRPNTIARSLRSKESKLIGVIIHSLDNQLVSLLVRGISDACFDNGYSFIIYNSYNDVEREKEYLRACIDQQVDGIILSPTSTNFDFYYNGYNRKIPIVMVNRFQDSWMHDAVFIDHFSLVKKALKHMWDNGYKKIMFITDNTLEISTKTWREQAFIEFANQHFTKEVSKFIARVDRLPRISEKIHSNIKEEIQQFYKSYPDEHKAVMACDAEILHKIIKVLQNMNVKIPTQLGLCGYDAWNWASLIEPGITTVTQPLYETGIMATELLVERIKTGFPYKAKIIKLEGQLNERKSTEQIFTKDRL